MTNAHRPPAPLLARKRVLRAYDHRDTTTVLGEDGTVRRFSGDSAGLVRAILGLTASPLARPELLARLSELAGGPVAWSGAVEEAIAILEAAGALRREAPPSSPDDWVAARSGR